MIYPLSQRKEKLIRKLGMKKFREEIGEFILEGHSLVREAIERPRDNRLILVAESAMDRNLEITDIADIKGVPVFQCSDRKFQELSDTVNPAGILSIIKRDVDQIKSWFIRRMDESKALILWLEGIQDPGNFGSIIRSAEASGLTAVIAGAGTVEITNPKTIRGSMGAIFHMPVLTIKELAMGFGSFRQKGFEVAATVISPDAVDMWQYEPPKKLLLLLGNEAHGLSFDTIEDADTLLTIPIEGKSESFGVAATGAIMGAVLGDKIFRQSKARQAAARMEKEGGIDT